MGQLILDISVSLNGFVAGPNPSLEEPLGQGGELLHEWAFAAAAWRERHGLEGGEANVDSELAGVAGEHEHRLMERRLVAPPPARPRVVLPRAAAAAEHLAAHDARADPGKRLARELRVDVRLAALEAVLLAPRHRGERPLVQQLAALAERVVERRVRAGDEAVERRRDVEDELSHRVLLVGLRDYRPASGARLIAPGGR